MNNVMSTPVPDKTWLNRGNEPLNREGSIVYGTLQDLLPQRGSHWKHQSEEPVARVYQSPYSKVLATFFLSLVGKLTENRYCRDNMNMVATSTVVKIGREGSSSHVYFFDPRLFVLRVLRRRAAPSWAWAATGCHPSCRWDGRKYRKLRLEREFVGGKHIPHIAEVWVISTPRLTCPSGNPDDIFKKQSRDVGNIRATVDGKRQAFPRHRNGRTEREKLALCGGSLEVLPRPVFEHDEGVEERDPRVQFYSDIPRQVRLEYYRWRLRNSSRRRVWDGIKNWGYIIHVDVFSCYFIQARALKQGFTPSPQCAMQWNVLRPMCTDSTFSKF
ncbi:hypothetical protein C8R44DRAFT_730422 [Mycena epipterygia]|nr:hypothetical protein C8R44DRAFT_730422 [Mycena epipterygia]